MPTAAAPENAIAVKRNVRPSLGLTEYPKSINDTAIRACDVSELTNFELGSQYSSLRRKVKILSEREC